MIAIIYITLGILYTIACVMDGPDIKPLWKRWLGSKLEAQAIKFKRIDYCNMGQCCYHRMATVDLPQYEERYLEMIRRFAEINAINARPTIFIPDTLEQKRIEYIVEIGEDDLFRAFARNAMRGGRSYGKSYEKEILIEKAKEVCFGKLMEACKPFVEFKIMDDEWKPGIRVCGAIEVGIKKK